MRRIERPNIFGWLFPILDISFVCDAETMSKVCKIAARLRKLHIHTTKKSDIEIKVSNAATGVSKSHALRSFSCYNSMTFVIKK